MLVVFVHLLQETLIWTWFPVFIAMTTWGRLNGVKKNIMFQRIHVVNKQSVSFLQQNLSKCLPYTTIHRTFTAKNFNLNINSKEKDRHVLFDC